ncbi:SGNH/GDSL hydrolase family protein [Actinophytocola sediminis]
MAIGDSFTEGVGDEPVDGASRGWADLVASGLASATGETVHYANLAVRGRLLEPIATAQLDAALALSPAPSLLSFNGGGNDMMRPGVDLARLVRLTEQVIRRCADAGVRLILLSGADPSARLPLGRMIHRRGTVLTTAVTRLAARHDLVFVDMFNDREIRGPGYWSADRLHLNSDGHRRVASRVLAALDHPVTAHTVAPPPAGARSVRAEARYYREHVLPWLNRRVRRQSSGDDRAGKHPTWVPVDALV